jgi:4-amino-4-deoxy-L-arabinose transferase-like glycosyltransferase
MMKGKSIAGMTILFLLLACIGASWFAYQCLLVPQPARFAPDWADAQWIQAADGRAPVAYFRYVTGLNSAPDAAFVTVAASQVFSLYVNGTLLGSNAVDFVQGNASQAYIYDVALLLRPGANVIAVRVANLDEQTPCVRASLGVVNGASLRYYGSGAGWLATVQSAAVYPRYGAKSSNWTTSSFDASSWPTARTGINPGIAPMLASNPLLYEQPPDCFWLSAGAGHEAFFVRRISQPFGDTSAWLRLAATGNASVFINGHLYMTWNGLPPVRGQKVADYLSDNDSTAQKRVGLAVGVYTISPYLHPGINTLAVHVVAPGMSAAQIGSESVGAAMSLDMLVSAGQNHSAWLPSADDWHASSRPVAGWTDADDAALAWPAPTLVGRPGASHIFYLPNGAPSPMAQNIPLVPVSALVLLTSGVIMALWLLISLLVVRRYGSSLRDALETMSLAYLPALACEALLIGLAREPQMPQPFPYTWFWGLILVVIAGAGYLLLWLNACAAYRQSLPAACEAMETGPLPVASALLWKGLLKGYVACASDGLAVDARGRIVAWLRLHWAIIPLVLIAIPLICYNLAYEPYWQDELSSFYAAQGVLTHGLPFFPSGFLYEKAELYSYLLAVWTLLFGDQGGIPRLISAIEYIVSIPLLYVVGCTFFERRIALLAAAMLALSPVALEWGRQVRMYEQAQLLTLLVMYVFYRALREPQRPRLIYLAVLCLVVDYLSHEEIFIVLPGLLVAVLMASWDVRRHLPAVLFQKHWWYASAMGAGIIAIQLLLTRITHPPVLGTDSSQRPFIQLTTDNIPYYFDLLFLPSSLAKGTLPWITMNSLLATLGCLHARWASRTGARYCAVFLVVSLLTLVLLFTMQADRYFYPLLPVYYLMGAYAMLMMLQAAWRFARARIVLRDPVRGAMAVPDGYFARRMRWTALCISGILCACVLITPMLPISNYNLFVSRMFGLSYHRHYPDYDAVGQYMQRHWRKGDIVIAVAPDFSVFYYVGHVDYFFSIDRALFLLERDGHIIDTSIGSIALLNQDDFQAVLAAHARVWIISDDGVYQAQAARRFVFPPDFRLVFEGYGSAVYLRGG